MEAGNEFGKATVEDLIANDAFLSWVKQPTDELDAYWNKVLTNRPQLEPTVREAKALVQQMRFNVNKPTIEQRERVFERIKASSGMDVSSQKDVFPIRRWLQLVAVLLLAVLSGVWIYNRYESKSISDTPDFARGGVDIREGVLFLSNGKALSLSALTPGTVVKEGDMQLTRTEAGKLIYQYLEGTSEVWMDSLISPIGQILEMEMPDGSNIWLNSGSAFRLVSMNDAIERRVEIDGQGYFEIAPNIHAPFTVWVDDVAVTVLGTQFDVANYADAPKTVTLVEGSVRVDHNKTPTQVLTPGQQVRYQGGGMEPTVTDVDLDPVIAWKNGLFSFQEDKIEEVMRQIGRWYGVEIRYEGARPEQGVTGTIPRATSLKEMLAILQDTGGDASFEISDGQVIVQKR